ncbi:hypothetical protein GSI_13338 [Ganoderma sinense ZZ0214-1]|uniref:Lysine-specific metallo-endopeptidase domain-containing protein n=1 Tax=Ganoderma sinense ZZ0214-1 TaxID=1077348 RepID=A0A2G8RVU1_9APHY|nr:hypothetical protein GSI_13338 [Ganoderma sinense ZZ0214-1]
MFSTSLLSALIILVVTATAACAAPGLALKVTVPDAIEGVENLRAITTLTNTGDQTLKLLNDPRGALHTFPTNAFAITTENGASPSFTGMKVKYSPGRAAKLTDPSLFTVLAPGESTSLTHDLSSAYNFTSTGHRSYHIAASNLFHFVDANNEISAIRADAQGYDFTLTGGKLAVVRPVLGRDAQFHGCSSSQRSALATAAPYANAYAASALAYLRRHPFTSTPRYKTWFGTYTRAGHALVREHFAHIAAHNYTRFTYDCTCTDPGVYAMVDPGELDTVYLCGAFWDAPRTGTDSQAGTLIHEASHFTANGGTDDYVYGQHGAGDLAASDPDEAVMNADSHEYFAENSPALS